MAMWFGVGRLHSQSLLLPKDPHNPKDRLWCFADRIGNVVWCEQDTYTREHSRFQAVELRWGRGGGQADPRSNESDIRDLNGSLFGVRCH